MKRYCLLPLAAVALLASCELIPIGPGAPSYFLATLEGAVQESYEGTGEFHTGTPGPGRKLFQMVSQGVGASRQQSFSITRWDGGQLGRGTYPITLVDLSGYERGLSSPAPRGITVQYFRTVGEIDELFVAESGEIEVTASSRSRFAGRFRFTGFRYCARQSVRSNPPVAPEGPCTLTATPIPGAPRIEVTGTFEAVPLRVEVDMRPELQVEVRDAAHDFLAGVQVEIRRGSSVVLRAATDRHGSVFTGPVAAGNYTVEVFPPQGYTLAPGQRNPTVIELKNGPGGLPVVMFTLVRTSPAS